MNDEQVDDLIFIVDEILPAKDSDLEEVICETAPTVEEVEMGSDDVEIDTEKHTADDEEYNIEEIHNEALMDDLVEGNAADEDEIHKDFEDGS